MKIRKLLNEIDLKFDSYDEAMDYIKSQVKSHGQKYYTTDEYKKLYPTLKSLHTQVKNKFIDKKSNELISNDVKNGDKIEITWANLFGSPDSVIGTLIMKGSLPYVKLPHKMSVNVNGKIVSKQTIPYSPKNMRKI